MTGLITIALHGSLGIHMLLALFALWLIWRGKTVTDRLIGLELASILFMAVLVLLALITGDSAFIDVAIGLGALGFISTIALAKYIADERMF